MSWVLLSDEALDDPRLLTLGRGQVLMHLEALAYSNRYGLDGRIPRRALVKLTTEPDPPGAASALVDAGLWADEGDAWQLVWLQDQQPTAAEMLERKEAAKRRMRHNRGKHDLCDPAKCWVLRQGSSPERSGERSHARSGHHSSPTLSSPKRREEKGERSTAGGAPATVDGQEAVAAAPPARWDWQPADELQYALASEAGFTDCSRCKGWFPESICTDEEGAGEYYAWCPQCRSMRRVAQRRKCLAFKKNGSECRNDRAGASPWCRYHDDADSRGQAGPGETRDTIDRQADRALEQANDRPAFITVSADTAIPAEDAVADEQPAVPRRELARIIREAPSDAMRHRYRKIFDRTYGPLYGRSAA